MINPTHLRSLLAVLETGSFAAAATRLGYTASAVSQQTAALERAAGVELFRRGSRQITPTPAAEAMARHARRVLTDLDAMLAAATGAAPDAATRLSVGIFPSLATYTMPRVVSSAPWTKANLGLRLRVAEPNHVLPGLLATGDLDLALVYQVGQGALAWPHRLQRRWLGEDPFRVVLPPRWKVQDGATLSPDQLRDMPWIMHHPGTPDASLIERVFTEAQLHPRVAAHCDDFNAALALSSAGLGALLIPDLVLRNSALDYVRVNVPEFRLSRSVYALFPEDPDGTSAGPDRTQQRNRERGIELLLDQVTAALR